MWADNHLCGIYIYRGGGGGVPWCQICCPHSDSLHKFIWHLGSFTSWHHILCQKLCSQSRLWRIHTPHSLSFALFCSSAFVLSFDQTHSLLSLDYSCICSRRQDSLSSVFGQNGHLPARKLSSLRTFCPDISFETVRTYWLTYVSIINRNSVFQFEKTAC